MADTSLDFDAVEARPETAHSPEARGLLERMLGRLGEPSFPFAIHLRNGAVARFGHGPPVFRLHVRSDAGMRALRSLHQLRIADAYIAGDLDFEGDMLAALTLKEAFSDRSPLLKVWRRLAPALFGRERYNPAWIAKHYDSNNIQLIAADRDYNTYTPGIYAGDEDTLEAGAERKLAAAFDALGASRGESVLDVGCGWGGFLRYAARRDVHVTGITLSRHQLAHDEALIARERLPAEVRYQDFFTFEPQKKFDGIVMMGVLEDLSDYVRVIRKLVTLIEPGRRIYLDFASSPKRFITGSFVTKHVWPGTFRMVYMPELMEALAGSGLEVVALHDDRWNYHLWARGVHERWVDRKEEVFARAGEEIWRMFRLLYAGCAAIMTRPSGRASAFRMVLERPRR